MNTTIIDPTKLEDTPAQMIAKMQVLDYLIMADDPSFAGIYKLNEFIRSKGIVTWFKEHEPRYYWTDEQMLENEKEL